MIDATEWLVCVRQPGEGQGMHKRESSLALSLDNSNA